MEELRKQIDILIARVENQKAQHMVYGLVHEMNQDEGQLQAFKLIKLLIDTNLQLTYKYKGE